MIGTRESLSGPAAYRMMEGVGAASEDFMKMGLSSAASAVDARRGGDPRRRDGREGQGARLGRQRRRGRHARAPAALHPGALRWKRPLSASVGYQYVLGGDPQGGNIGDDIEAIVAGRTALEELANTWRKIFPDALAWADPGDDAALATEEVTML